MYSFLQSVQFFNYTVDIIREYILCLLSLYLCITLLAPLRPIYRQSLFPETCKGTERLVRSPSKEGFSDQVEYTVEVCACAFFQPSLTMVACANSCIFHLSQVFVNEGALYQLVSISLRPQTINVNHNMIYR